MGKFGLTNILRNTTIKNNKRIVEVTERTGEIQINENELNTRLTTFEMIKRFFPSAIGMEYKATLPKNFLFDCFKDCDDEYELDHNTISETERIEKSVEYINSLTDLTKRIKTIIRPIVEVVSSVGATKSTFKDLEYSKFVIENKLVTGKICERCDHEFEDGGEHYPVQKEIKFPNFSTVKKILSTQGFIEKLIYEVQNIFTILNNLSNISAYLDQNNNSFRKFTAEIFISMNGNYQVEFPRSIVNYTAFHFAIPGYPLETPGKRLYSISNVTGEIQNKYQIEEIFIKNINAISDFLTDVMWYCNDFLSSNENIENVKKQVQLLKIAYGVTIALVGLYGEEKLWEGILSGNYKFSDVHKSCQLLDTQTGAVLNECRRYK